MPDKKDATPVKKAAVLSKRPAKKPALKKPALKKSDPPPPPTVYPTSVEVLRSDKKWRVIAHFNTGAAHEWYVTKKKVAAHGFGRGLASALGDYALKFDRSLELIIKKRNGQIESKDSFGRDPADIPG